MRHTVRRSILRSRPSLPTLLTVFAPLALLAGIPVPGRAQDAPSEPLRLEQYLDMEGVDAPRLSPDGSRIVYVRNWIDPMEDSRESALWIVDTDGSGHRHLGPGNRPRWSPSGDRLAFLACGTAGGDPSAPATCPEGATRQLWVRAMEGPGEGNRTQVTRLTEAVTSFSWAPSGDRLALVRFVEEPDDWTVELPGKPPGASWTPDPYTTDEVWWRRDRRGLMKKGYPHIFVVPDEGGTPRQVTPDGLRGHDDIWGTDDPRWSPDGRRIYYDASPREEPDLHWATGGYGHLETEIYSVDVETLEVRRLTNRVGTDQNPRPSPDGRWVAYTGVDSTFRSYVTDELYVIRPDGTERRHLTPDFGRSPGRLLWAPDGRGVYFTAGSEGSEDLYLATLEGEVRRVSSGGPHVLETHDVGRDGRAVAIRSTPERPGDVVVFQASGAGDGFRRVTRVNDDVLGRVRLGEVEEIRYRAADGTPVQGWVVKPPGFQEDRRYPTILSIHGGPHAMYDVGFRFSFQHWAAQGFLVVYVNPRGSTGDGAEFGNAIDKAYPGDDLLDLLAGVDHVVERGWADPENLFVTGCSGGGTLTAWAIVNTDRFRAAVARCPIVNWISFQGTVDGPYWYNWFPQRFWEDPSGHL